jgi:hypothetical protein
MSEQAMQRYGGQPLRELDQQLRPSEISHQRVHALEVVDVDEQHRDPTSAPDGLLDPGPHGRQIGETGPLVVGQDQIVQRNRSLGRQQVEQGPRALR